MKRERPKSFFSGGELRGLILFALLTAIGWPVILNYARPKADPPKPKVIDSRPLEPDTSIAFQGLLDKTPIDFRDTTALITLYDRARETSAETLARIARRDVFFTHLWERPDLYRGVPIHLEGTLLKVLPHEKVDPVFALKGRLVEAWFVTSESRPFPYVVMIEEPPAGLPIGGDLSEPVRVDGYFLRLLGYRAGDAWRAAPLLVGRIQTDSTGVPAGGPAAPRPRNSWTVPTTVVIGFLGLYVAFRLFFQIRKTTAPARTRIRTALNDRPVDDIAPEDLARFLESVPDDPDEKPL